MPFRSFGMYCKLHMCPQHRLQISSLPSGGRHSLYNWRNLTFRIWSLIWSPCGCMSIISRRLILISSVALFKLLLTIWNCSPSNRLRVHWKLKARHLYKTIAYPSRWLGRKVRSNCLSNVWLPCVVLWWHCYYTTRNVSRIWSPRDLSSTPVTLTLTWLTSKGKWSNWLCAFTWRIVWYHISFLRLSMRW